MLSLINFKKLHYRCHDKRNNSNYNQFLFKTEPELAKAVKFGGQLK